MRFLQKYPHLLEFIYRTSRRLLVPFRRWLRGGGKLEWLFIKTEELSKGLIFDCQMCGQCVLHSTGMTCPMTCPKNLRNGPCGGVRSNGHCEIIPDMPCIWVQAWERTKSMPYYGQEIFKILPPLNQQLKNTSAWINDFSKKTQPPAGWKDQS